jgi:hypothetical protein
MKTYLKVQRPKSKEQSSKSKVKISVKHKKSGISRFFYSKFELYSLVFALIAT